MNFLKNDATSSAIYVVSSSIIGLLLTTLSLNFLGSELYGLWILILTILILGMFGEQGLGLPIIRLISANNPQKNQEVLSTSLVPIVTLIIFIFFLIFFSNGLFVDYLIDSNLKIPAPQLILPFMGVILSLFLMSIVPTAFLTGMKKIYIANYLKASGRFIQIITAYVLFSKDFGFWSLIISLLSYHVFVVICSVLISLRSLNLTKPISKFFNKKLFDEILSVGYKIVLGRIVGLGIDPFFKFTLGYFLGLNFVAYFDVAFKVTALITQVPIVALKGRIPIFNELRENNNFHLLKKEIKKIDLLISFYVIPLSVFMFLTADFFLQIWLLDGYNQRILIALYFLVPTMSFYIFAHMRELYQIAKGDSLTTLRAYSINAFVLPLAITIIFISSFSESFLNLMFAYCFAHLCASVFIFIVYFRNRDF